MKLYFIDTQLVIKKMQKNLKKVSCMVRMCEKNSIFAIPNDNDTGRTERGVVNREMFIEKNEGMQQILKREEFEIRKR